MILSLANASGDGTRSHGPANPATKPGQATAGNTALRQHGSPAVTTPELNTLYWTIGNPGPDINGDVRKGDNLYSCSVVALDPDTGKLKWHYQFTPGNDTHDWDATEDVVLVDRMWHRQNRKLLMQSANRNVTAFFYVLDRITGQVPGGYALRTRFVGQSDSTKTAADHDRKLARQSRRGLPFIRRWVAGRISRRRSYSPQTGWMYFMYYDGPGRYSIGPAPYEPGKQFQGRGTGGGFGPPPSDGQAPPSQGLMAFDPETGKSVWKFELTQNGASLRA